MIVVDVLLPYHKGSSFIDAQVNSILNQKDVEIRLFLLDDCSPKAEYNELLKRYEKIENIKILRNEKNLGVVKSFEKLINLSDSAYIALSDQDDVWELNKLSLSVAKLKEADVDLIYTDVRVVDKHLDLIHPSKWKFSNTPAVSGNDCMSMLIKNPVTGCTVVLRGEFAWKAVPFPTQIPMHDRWLGILAARGKGVGYVDRATMDYRQHNTNVAGGLPFSMKGLMLRINKDSDGLSLSYFSQRLAKRIRLIDGLEEKGALTSDLIFVRDYYRSPLVKKIFLSPWYFKIIRKSIRTVGIKNVFIDFGLSFFPTSISLEKVPMKVL